MNYSKGFTLIEVLISAVILFSAIALTAELFSSSNLLSEKIEKKALFYQVNPIAVSSIKSQVKTLAKDKSKTTFSGDLLILGIKYKWEADRISLDASPNNIDDLGLATPQFGIFNVSVLAKNNGLKSTKFNIKVSTW